MKADVILKSRAVFDAVRREPCEGFVAVAGNKIAAVGNDQNVMNRLTGRKTEIIDCGNRLIIPGLIDAHMHFFNGIFQNSPYMCRELFDCKSAKECVQTVDRFAKQHPDYKRISAIGWYIPDWEDKTYPHKRMLDAIEPERPVYLMCADGHSFWLNSKALEECGVDPDKQLLCGTIETDSDGEVNGLLHEMDACSICAAKAQELPQQEARQMILNFVCELSKKGITAVTDMAIQLEPTPIPGELMTLSELENEGSLHVRLALYPSLGITDDFSIAREYRNRFCSDKLYVGGLKSFVDGVHGNYTALLLEPYADDPNRQGKSCFPYEIYEKQVAAANKEGFGVKLHCTGEGASELALDAFEMSRKANGNIDVRNSIEHAETLRYPQFERFRRLNVTATMQPSHLMAIGNGLKRKVGEQRAQYEYALKTMLSHDVNVAFSSDYPVAPFDPLLSIYFAVTRCDKQGNPIDEINQNITLEQALKAYTYGSAYCIHAEDKLGTLEPGKLADIVVFNQNLFELEPKEWLNAKIDLTMMDGEIVYKSEEF